jgi:hypothetical protein
VRLVRPFPRTPFSLAFFRRRSSAGVEGTSWSRSRPTTSARRSPVPKYEVHDGPVTPRPGVPVHCGRLVAAAVAAAVQLVEAFDPVQHVLDRPHLRLGKGADLRSRKAEQVDLLSRVAVAQQSGGGVHGDPGEEGGQVGEVIVDRGRCHRGRGAVTAEVAFFGQVVAPGGNLARGDGRDPVVAEPGGEPVGEPLQMPGDLPGHLIRPYAPEPPGRGSAVSRRRGCRRDPGRDRLSFVK